MPYSNSRPELATQVHLSSKRKPGRSFPLQRRVATAHVGQAREEGVEGPAVGVVLTAPRQGDAEAGAQEPLPVLHARCSRQ